jgi:hypothetical protein
MQWSLERPRIGIFLALILASACGDERNPTVVIKGDGRVAEDGAIIRVDGRVNDLTLPDFGNDDPGAPTIEIQSPTEGQTIVGNTMTVKARVTDPDGVDDQSVTLTVQDVAVVTMGVTATPGVYEALVDVTSIVGARSLWVSAKDFLGNSATSKPLGFTRDPGPTVVFLSPVENSRHRASTSVQVSVADPTAITSFKVTIGNQELTMSETASGVDRKTYSGTVVFDDPKWGPPLKGVQVLTATATNQNGATTIEQRRFVIDREGPNIVVSSHSAGSLVGGVIDIEVIVTDEASVVPSSVNAIIGNNLVSRQVQLQAVAGSPGAYEGQFDTRTLAANDLFPIMSFRAADLLGNESHLDFEVWLDNGQPILSLDPPKIIGRREEKEAFECSVSFDPIGDWAASDGEEVPQITMLRARIEDQGNGSVVPSARWVPLAYVNQNSVKMYVLDDTTIPLVIDTTGDGYCDSINSNVIPSAGQPAAGQAVALRLGAIGPTGSPNYTLHSQPLPSICDRPGSDPKPPGALCKNTKAPVPDVIDWADFTVTKSYAAKKDPSVYAIEPIIGGDPALCAGAPFDFKANNFKDGWVCIAVSAQDNLGLTGVSAPMRLYYNSTLKKYVKGTMSTATPIPDCTGSLDKASGNVNSTPCKFRQLGESFPQTFTFTSFGTIEVWDQF